MSKKSMWPSFNPKPFIFFCSDIPSTGYFLSFFMLFCVVFFKAIWFGKNLRFTLILSKSCYIFRQRQYLFCIKPSIVSFFFRATNYLSSSIGATKCPWFAKVEALFGLGGERGRESMPTWSCTRSLGQQVSNK